MPVKGQRKTELNLKYSLEKRRGQQLYRIAMFWRKNRVPELMTIMTGLISEWLDEDERGGRPPPAWPEADIRRARAKIVDKNYGKGHRGKAKIPYNCR